MRKLLRRAMLVTALAVIAVAVAPQLASADTLTKVDGTAGCVADPASSVPAGTCVTAKGIDDATDVAISPDGKFLYAAATSSNSIAIFSRNAETGELTQLQGNAGCIAASEKPIAGCATGNGLEGPSALAISPDGKNIYVTTFKLDTGSTTPTIQGTLTTFDRDERSGRLTQAQNGCVAGTVPSALTITATPPSGCGAAMVTFDGSLTRRVPLGTASDVEVSPDGKSVVTSSFLAGAVVNWSRDPGNGKLQPKECFGSTRSLFPTNGNPLPTDNVCADASLLEPDTGGKASGLAFPLDVEFAPDGKRLYAASLGLEQPETKVGPVKVLDAADEPGSVAVFDRAADGKLSQAADPNGCIDDARDPVQPDTTCAHRTGLLNPYRVNASPDGKNVYVGALNVFPPAGLAGPGPGELAQFNADLTPLDPPCIQQLGLPAGDLQPTEGCALTAFGLILPSDIAFSPDGGTAYITSLFHSVGSYERSAETGALTQDAPPAGCSIDPRNLLEGTELLAQICQNAIPLNAPTSIQISPDGKFGYVTSGGFLTGNPSFGPAFAEAGVTSDDAITVLGPTPPVQPPPVEPPPEPPAPVPTCNLLKATIVGVPSKGKVTKINGTKGDDVIVGTDGNDRIRGRGGDDTICALRGKDKVNGGKGADTIDGGPGRDKIKGNGGKDALFGAKGRDTLKGGNGNDRLNGGPGRDKLDGGPGKNVCKPSKQDKLKRC